MSDLESISLYASLGGVGITILVTVIAFVSGRSNNSSDAEASLTRSRNPTAIAVTVLSVLTFILVTLTIVFRAIQTAHGPFSNMYEFSIAFAWGIVGMSIAFEWRYKTSAVKNIAFLAVLLLLIFSVVQHSKPAPLVPALQQSVLLSVHVASAVIAYGVFTIGFGAAILYLIQNRRNSRWLPDEAVLDSITYQSVIIGFPFLTLTIVLGALWGDIAWGRYWGWDPKETASLVTWLLYGIYIHTRVIRGWKGTRSAVLLIIGFGAVLLTFFGNYIFAGLHSYR